MELEWSKNRFKELEWHNRKRMKKVFLAFFAWIGSVSTMIDLRGCQPLPIESLILAHFLVHMAIVTLSFGQHIQTTLQPPGGSQVGDCHPTGSNAGHQFSVSYRTSWSQQVGRSVPSQIAVGEDGEDGEVWGEKTWRINRWFVEEKAMARDWSVVDVEFRTFHSWKSESGSIQCKWQITSRKSVSHIFVQFMIPWCDNDVTWC